VSNINDEKRKLVETSLHPISKTDAYRIWHIHIGETVRFRLVANGRMLSDEFIELSQDEIIKSGTSFYEIYLDKFNSFKLDSLEKEEENNEKEQKEIPDNRASL